MKIVQRVETHIIRRNKNQIIKANEKLGILEDTPFYDWLMNEMHLSKNLYNKILYIYRQAYNDKLENIPEYLDAVQKIGEIEKTDKDNNKKKVNLHKVNSFKLANIIRALNDPDFRIMMKSRSAQMVLKQVDECFKSWVGAIKSFKKDKSKFKGCPKIPSYKNKDGVNMLIYDKLDASLQKDGTINISRGIKLPIHTNLSSLQQVRLIPKSDYVKIEIVYKKEIEEVELDKSKAFGVDIGLNNLLAIASNDGKQPFLINGRPLKSINHYYNKRKAKLKSILDKSGTGQKTSKRLQRLERKRFFKVKDFLHKASRTLVNLMQERNYGTIFIGHNNGWKQNINLGARTNQNFVQIPFNMLINMIQYKFEEIGGNATVFNESHTSVCSFLDDEKICHHDKYVGDRNRRRFKTATGRILNSDINAAYNMLRRGLKISTKDMDFGNEIFNPYKLKVEKATTDTSSDIGQVVQGV